MKVLCRALTLTKNWPKPYPHIHPKEILGLAQYTNLYVEANVTLVFRMT
jgi:hypothetical protein